ncbi:MAG: TonB-dependent receptor [Bacteroidales bacterium]|nr:TonB-dependent receptor [Bacteroidales bacterium]
MRNLVLLFSLLFVYLISYCQENVYGRVTGKVMDKQSQFSLPGVNIIINSASFTIGGITDESGNFKLEQIPVGRFNIKFSYIGYETIELDNIILTSAKDVYLTIEMLEKIEEIEQVVISAYQKHKPINELATISARSFTIEETEKYAGSWGDPARMASNYAGVITANDNRNDIIIRGNSPTGLLWRLEGVSIPNPNHFGTFGTTGGPICMLNNNQLTNSDFFTGAFPAEYGNAISGVFDLKMRNGNNDKYEFMGQMGFNGFELGAEGPFSKNKKSSFLINYRYTMMDLMNAMGLFDVGGVPLYTDLSFKLFLPTKKIGAFSIFGLGGISKIKLEEEKGSGWTADMLPGTKVNYGSEMSVIGIINKYFFSENARLETSVSTSFKNSFNDVDTLRNMNYEFHYEDIYSEFKYSFSSKFSLKKDSKNTIQAGILVDIYDFNYYDKFFDLILNDYMHYTDMNDQTTLYQAYIQLKHRFNDIFSANFGLYSQLHALNNSKSLEPRLGFKYLINPKQSLSFGYGLHAQMQPTLIYFTQTLIDTTGMNYIYTNKNLDFTKAHHFAIGYDYLIRKNLRIKTETYYQYVFNIPVETEPSYFNMVNYGADFYNEKVDYLINEGIAENYGVELTIEKFFNKNYYFLLTTSLYQSKYQGSDKIWRNSAFNGNYVVNLLGGYELPLKNNVLAINIKNVWAGGKRYIPIDREQSVLNGKTVYNISEAYKRKYSDYFRIDLRISFRKNSEKISQEWAFEVQNLTNHKNLLIKRFDQKKNEVIDILQIGFFPIGFWKIYF